MKQILITIDTEVGELGLSQPNAFRTFVEGKVDGGEYGYQKIIELLNVHKAKGEFFVDVYPVKQVGEKKLSTLCKNIVKAGHAVQLHTHPSSAFDPKRRYLSEYAIETQREIIKTGLDSIQKWTGVPAIAHRAGGYGMNESAITVLQEAGVKYDSSYHYQNEHCTLPLVHKNAPYKINEVWEIPVSGFNQHVNYMPNGPVRLNFQKLDFRYGARVKDIERAITEAPDNSVHVIFLHSFNFLNLTYNTKSNTYLPIHAVPKLIKQFEELLEWLAKQDDCRFTGFSDLTLDHLSYDFLVDIPTKRSLFSHLYDIFQTKFRHLIKT